MYEENYKFNPLFMTQSIADPGKILAKKEPAYAGRVTRYLCLGLSLVIA